MKIDKLIIILASVCAVLGISLILGLLLPGLFRSGKNDIAVFPGMIPANVKTIELSDGKSVYNLRSANEGWVLESADLKLQLSKPAMDEMLALLGKTRTRRLVSENGQGLEKLGFTTESGKLSTKLELRDSKDTVLLSLRLARSLTGKDTYAIINQNPAIWVVDPALYDLAVKTPSSWAELALFPGLKEPDVVSFTITKSDSNEIYAYQASDKVWKGSGSVIAETAASNDIASLLRQIITLEATNLTARTEAELTQEQATREKKFTISVSAKEAYAFELWQKPASEDDYLVVYLSKRTTLDGKVLSLTIPAWKVGDLSVQKSTQNP